jgi:hypothetical protein
MSGRTRARGGLSDMASWGSWDGGEMVERGRALAVVRGWRVYRAGDAELLAGCVSRAAAERFAAAVSCEVVVVPPGQPEPAPRTALPEALEGASTPEAPAEPAHALPSKPLPAPAIARELRIVLGGGAPDRYGRILWLRALERTAPAPWHAIGGVHRLADRDD